MCGTIRKSENPYQAVEYALAYAVDYVRPNYGRPENKHTPSENDVIALRHHAKAFIGDYTPAEQRTMAIHLLAQRPDDQLFSSEVDYWRDVIE